MTGSYLRATTRWCLESTVDGGRSLERVPLIHMPFRIGRSLGLELTLPSQSVSKRHAEFQDEEDMLRLRDLESTNGTFVNRKRVSEALVREGDIIHFAGFEFRLSRRLEDAEQTSADSPERGTLSLTKVELSQQFVGGTRELEELLEHELATTVFQPIVSLPHADIAGYEVLGRGLHDELPHSPTGLFRIAESAERAAELSRLFRKKALELAAKAKCRLPLLFLNTHPAEIGEPELIESLRELRKLVPDLDLALEIHEGALAEPQVIAELKHDLEALGIKLALDDFGLGERFLQLAEVPPDYLKFDISFVKGLVDASIPKRRLLSMLMAASREVGARTIAEGVETEREASVCQMMGFDMAQGYLFSKPATMAEIADLGSDTLERTLEQEVPILRNDD